MDLEQRVAAVEADIQELREKVADAHTLAAHADHDVAEFRDELRAQTKLMNLARLDMAALRTTVTDNYAEQQGEMGAMRDEMRAGFATMKAGMQHIVALLSQGDQA